MPKSTPPSPSTPRRLVTQQAGAEHYGVTDRTIRNMIRRGEIVGYRVGPSKRSIRVDLTELDRLLDRNRIPAGGDAA